jgi:hypothetical protein
VRDFEIERFLSAEGFETEDLRRCARGALEAAGLTRPGKRRIAEEKLGAARAALAASLLRVCGDAECARLARRGPGAERQAVRVPAPVCEVCGGSNNRRAVRALAERLRRSGLRRLLVVGGKQAQHAELREALAAAGLELRCVDGTSGTFSRRDAAPQLEWAQLLVVWGGTQLPHKVSRLYTDDPPRHLRGRTVKLAKRGVEAVCREILQHFE